MIPFPVQDGSIHFDRTTGTVVGSDEGITAARIPETIEGVRVAAIGDRAFAGRPLLHTVTLPPTLTDIGRFAFADCGQLQTLTLPAAPEQLGEGVFAGSGLRQIDLPARLRHLPAAAFARTPLERISLPHGLLEIGEDAFSQAEQLTEVSLPATLLVIGSSAFSGCTALHTLTLPPSLVSIGSFAFADSGLTRLTLPPSLTFARADAFAHEGRAMQLTFRGSERRWMELIGRKGKLLETPLWEGFLNGVFAYSQNTRPSHRAELTFTDEDYAPPPPESGVTAVPLPGGSLYFERATATVVGCDRQVEEVVVPAEIDGIPVRVIGTRAFAAEEAVWQKGGERAVRRIVLPRSVTAIGREAFVHCRRLREAVLPEGLQTVGRRAFFGCTALQELSLPASVTSVGSGAFWIEETPLKLLVYGGSQERWEAIERQAAGLLPVDKACGTPRTDPPSPLHNALELRFEGRAAANRSSLLDRLTDRVLHTKDEDIMYFE
ncbi:MAG: leucine-rich repeat domain-containing protein [Clostridia bacterium]|nr:leucine-rich repeat domain-containing protein [Clostridia bacterium]